MQYTNLEHSGVKNQKWGIRRYQNPDGSLTPEGRRHYGVGAPRKPNLMERMRVRSAEKKRYRELEKEAARKRAEERFKASQPKDLSQLSTQEINEMNARMRAEQEYNRLTSPQQNTQQQPTYVNPRAAETKYYQDAAAYIKAKNEYNKLTAKPSNLQKGLEFMKTVTSVAKTYGEFKKALDGAGVTKSKKDKKKDKKKNKKEKNENSKSPSISDYVKSSNTKKFSMPSFGKKKSSFSPNISSYASMKKPKRSVYDYSHMNF